MSLLRGRHELVEVLLELPQRVGLAAVALAEGVVDEGAVPPKTGGRLAAHVDGALALGVALLCGAPVDVDELLELFLRFGHCALVLGLLEVAAALREGGSDSLESPLVRCGDLRAFGLLLEIEWRWALRGALGATPALGGVRVEAVPTSARQEDGLHLLVGLPCCVALPMLLFAPVLVVQPLDVVHVGFSIRPDNEFLRAARLASMFLRVLHFCELAAACAAVLYLLLLHLLHGHRHLFPPCRMLVLHRMQHVRLFDRLLLPLLRGLSKLSEGVVVEMPRTASAAPNLVNTCSFWELTPARAKRLARDLFSVFFCFQSISSSHQLLPMVRE
mmetsp:Transcript_48587/g.122593  ORF Transcript_48587/g.122593 Transcript_48587/m.122593 type:complete len:331 (-) Transcript_48587:2029-3021(-)